MLKLFIALLSVTAVLLPLFFFWLGYQWSRNTGRAIKRQRIEILHRKKTVENVCEENETLTRLNKTYQKTIKSLQKDNEWYKKERKRFNDIRREDRDKLWSLQTKAKRDEEALRSMIQNLRCKNTDLKNSCNILRHCIVKLQKGMGNEQNHMKSLKRQLHTVCKSTGEVTKSIRVASIFSK